MSVLTEKFNAIIWRWYEDGEREKGPEPIQGIIDMLVASHGITADEWQLMIEMLLFYENQYQEELKNSTINATITEVVADNT